MRTGPSTLRQSSGQAALKATLTIQVSLEAKARRYLARVQEPARRLDEQARVRKKRDELKKSPEKIGALRRLLNQKDGTGNCSRTL